MSTPVAKPARRYRAWAGIGLSLLVLLLMIIFIAQNTARTNVSFLGFSGGFPLAAALLAAVLAGALLAAAVGMTLAAQRRRRARD